MHQPFNHTALILFSRSSAAEARQKSFFSQHSIKRNRQLASRLIQHTVAIGKASGLPFFICDEQHQSGNDFGERLANALELTYAKGYTNIIVIGNDCPQITTATVLEAASLLQENTQVLVPTTKGGVSLIGLQKKTFNKVAFCSIPWQTNKVYQALESLYPESTFSLSVTDDINNRTDLQKLLPRFRAIIKLYQFVISLIASCTAILSFSTFIPSFYYQHFFGLKAPPAEPYYIKE